MTSKRFLHSKRRGLFSSERARKMNHARWAADRARRDEEEPERRRHLAKLAAINLPRNKGDLLGTLQWTDHATGRVRRWAWLLSHLRPFLCGTKVSHQ